MSRHGDEVTIRKHPMLAAPRLQIGAAKLSPHLDVEALRMRN